MNDDLVSKICLVKTWKYNMIIITSISCNHWHPYLMHLSPFWLWRLYPLHRSSQVEKHFIHLCGQRPCQTRSKYRCSKQGHNIGTPNSVSKSVHVNNLQNLLLCQVQPVFISLPHTYIGLGAYKNELCEEICVKKVFSPHQWE